MAHYALLDENNIVVNVITGIDEDPNIDYEQVYTEVTGYKCLRTSYNTSAGIHFNGKEPFRKNMATIGGTYDPILDAFIAQKPYPSWILNTESCTWEPPVPPPDTTGDYGWDEETVNWVLFD